jgi:hypothetical protein
MKAFETKPLPLVLGITGYGQSGKDTLARLISEAGEEMDVPVYIVRLAQPLKAGIESLTYSLVTQEAMEDGEAKASHPPLFGGDSLRKFLIDLGDFCRARNEDFFVGLALYAISATWMRGAPDKRAVFIVPDIRRNNELVIANEVIRVVRPNTGPAANHPTEGELDEYECTVIENTGSLDELKEKAREFFTDFIAGPEEYVTRPEST